ncbi:hypothetical protein A0H81_07099 [Grifola frondosa]|uniref:Oxidoreductase YusZ n=1 Tax=Grifola frondosa TaxID=5627 RepID=A0A1C7MDF9_GRIFR|nr:hypothetical protein A0H81_07099 [Grifola frondosa]
MATPRVWLITGASSGFGLEMTRLVLERGDIAVATLRKPEVLSDLVAQYPKDKLLVLKVDVSKHGDIINAFAKTREVFGRLDVVFNNAGYAVMGEVEGTPDDVARAMFEVNFWGAAHVSQEAVKFFREVNKPGVGGRLIQISSGTGVTGWPSTGFYSATKHALEGLSETLYKELDPAWNIKLTIVVLGAFKTNVIKTGMVVLPPHPAYSNPALQSVIMRSAILASVHTDNDPRWAVPGDTKKAVKVLYRLSELTDPPLRLPLGKDSVTICRDKIASFTADVDQYEPWSEGITRSS